MKSEEFRKNGHALIDWMADYMDSVENLDVRSQVKPGDILLVLMTNPQLKVSPWKIFSKILRKKLFQE